MSKLVESRLAPLSPSVAGPPGAPARSANRCAFPGFTRSKRLDGFIVRGRELAAESADVFRADPVRLIRVFRHGQQLDCALDLHLRELIRESLPLLTPEVSASADATVRFRAILSEVGAVYPRSHSCTSWVSSADSSPAFDGLACVRSQRRCLPPLHGRRPHAQRQVFPANSTASSPPPSPSPSPSIARPCGEGGGLRLALPHVTTCTTLAKPPRGLQGHAESGVRL